jgi:hypothetical protein
MLCCTAPLWPKQCPLSVKSVPSMFCPPFCIQWLSPLILHCAVWLALCLHLFALPNAASSAGVTYQVVKLEEWEDSRHRPLSRTVGADKGPLAVCRSIFKPKCQDTVHHRLGRVGVLSIAIVMSFHKAKSTLPLSLWPARPDIVSAAAAPSLASRQICNF